MLSRRNFLKTIGAGGALVATPNLASAFNYCDNWQYIVLWDFQHALWGSARPDIKDSLYMVAAPWCPYAKKAAIEYINGDFPFDLRIIPTDARQRKHRPQQVDIVLNGMEGIRRTYSGGEAPAFSPQMISLVHDANLLANDSYLARLSDMAHPTIIHNSKDSPRRLAGYFPWKDVQENFIGWEKDSVNFALELPTIDANYKRFSKPKKCTVAHRTAIHSLPDHRSPTNGCDIAKELIAVGEIHHQNDQWLRVIADYTHDNEPIHGFIRTKFLT